MHVSTLTRNLRRMQQRIRTLTSNPRRTHLRTSSLLNMLIRILIRPRPNSRLTRLNLMTQIIINTSRLMKTNTSNPNRRRLPQLRRLINRRLLNQRTMRNRITKLLTLSQISSHLTSNTLPRLHRLLNGQIMHRRHLTLNKNTNRMMSTTHSILSQLRPHRHTRHLSHMPRLRRQLNLKRISTTLRLIRSLTINSLLIPPGIIMRHPIRNTNIQRSHRRLRRITISLRLSPNRMIRSTNRHHTRTIKIISNRISQLRTSQKILITRLTSIHRRLHVNSTHRLEPTSDQQSTDANKPQHNATKYQN